jgi:hypothetical protein
MTDSNHPLCPNCKEPIHSNGECYKCEYETNENYLDSENDPAAIYDSKWEQTYPVKSLIKVYEHSESNSFTKARGSFPFVCLRAYYPTGSYGRKIPMFSKGLPFDNGHLTNILRVEREGPRDTNHPFVVAVYSRSTESDMMLKFRLTDESAEIEEFKGRNELLGKVTNEFWSADHPQTTDPLNDISLAEDKIEANNE